jgi:hypothetical protein
MVDHPGPDISGKGNLGQALFKEASPAEYRLLAKGHAGAVCETNGTLRLAQFPVPEGADSRLHYRIVEERDHSSLPGMVVAAVGTLEETVIDRTLCPPRRTRKGALECHRIVSAHARGDGRYWLVTMLRRDEEGDDGASSLSGSVLRDYLDIARAHSLDVAAAPLFGLDSELADSKERLLLTEEGISYAILIEASHPFSHVRWHLPDAPDVLKRLAAEVIVNLQWPQRDLTKVSTPVPILDLHNRTGGSTEKLQEFLVEVPVVDDDPLHFLVGGLEPAAGQGVSLLTRAQALAETAAARLQAPPARDLRIQDFQHPKDERFRVILTAVDYGRAL